MKKVAASFFALCFLGAAILWIVEEIEAVAPSHADSIQVRLDSSGADVPKDPPVLEPVSPSVRADSTREAGGAAAGSASPVHLEEESQVAATLCVAGSVAVIDGPVNSSLLDGEIVVSAWNRESKMSVPLRVVAGQFRAELSPSQLSELRALGRSGEFPAEIDGLRVSIEDPVFEGLGPCFVVNREGQIPRAKEDHLSFGTKGATVWLKRTPSKRLDVVDRETGAALSGVSVFATFGIYRPDAAHMEGRGPISLTDDTLSPVALSPPGALAMRSQVDAVVGADGHAWTPIKLNLSVNGTRKVELERGATLTVTIEGKPPRGARLRLRDDQWNWKPLGDLPLHESGSTTWENLVSGSYSVALEVGNWRRSPPIYAAAQVKVAPGEAAEVTLTVETEETEALPQQAAASGVLVVPLEWKKPGVAPQVKLVSSSASRSSVSRWIEVADCHPVEGSPGTFHFRFPALEVGRYEVRVRGLTWWADFVLPPEGLSDLRFEVPAPVSIAVQVVDDAMEAPLEIMGVLWHPVLPESALHPIANPVLQAESPGLFLFETTRGEISIAPFGDEFEMTSTKVNAQEGASFTIKAKRRTRAFVFFLDGNVQVPCEEFTAVQLEGAKATLHTSTNMDRSRCLQASEPGAYRLIVPEINGYAPHPPIEFEMIEGQDTEVVVRLTPE